MTFAKHQAGFIPLAMSLVLVGPPAAADPEAFTILPGATIQFDGEAPKSLSGAFEIECRPDPASFLPCNFQTGDVTFDLTSLELATSDFALSAEGESPLFGSPGFSFSFGRQVVL